MDTRQQNTLAHPKQRRGGQRGSTVGKPRSLPIAEWPEADRLGWIEALRPAHRLKRGGGASYLAPVSQADIANRYGLYLDYLQRNDQLGYSCAPFDPTCCWRIRAPQTRLTTRR